MKIGIEIDDRLYHDKDFTNLVNGNPGIGGIHYQMLMLGYSLTDYFPEKYEVSYYHYDDSNLYPDEINHILCDDSIDAIKKAAQDEIDYFISNCNQTDRWYEELRKIDLKVLVRAGCYLDKREVDLVMNTKQVVRVIAVSSEEYDFYMDHDIQERMICVENSMSYRSVSKRNEHAYESHQVTYIGSLVPQKGFLRLAKIWPKVIKRIPDATLQVIGSGKLYSSDAKLGKYGIAEEKFENAFMKYLVDQQGQIHPSVHFLGVVEGQKGDILKNTAVGIVNPIAKTECCCTSSLDFEACGIPVVTCGRQGLPSTVLNKKTGYTFQTTVGFYLKLIKLLTNGEENVRLGNNAEEFTRYFDRESMIYIWNRELTFLENGNSPTLRRSNKNYYNDWKWFKVVNRFLRKKCGLQFLPSAIDWREYFLNVCHVISSVFRIIEKGGRKS